MWSSQWKRVVLGGGKSQRTRAWKRALGTNHLVGSLGRAGFFSLSSRGCVVVSATTTVYYGRAMEMAEGR